MELSLASAHTSTQQQYVQEQTQSSRLSNPISAAVPGSKMELSLVSAHTSLLFFDKNDSSAPVEYHGS